MIETVKGLLLISLLFVCTASHSYTEEKSIKLNIVDFPSTSVKSIAQDSKGFIWLGTTDGLYSYDGYEAIKHNVQNAENIALSEFTVNSIYADPNSNLWLGTFYGLIKYDLTSRSLTYFKHNAEDPESISSNFIYTVSKYDNERLILGTARGVTVFNISDFKAHNLLNKSINKKLGSDRLVYGTINAAENEIWVNSGYELSRLNILNNDVTDYQLPISDGKMIREIIKTRDGLVIVATKEGLFYYDTENDTFEIVDPAFKNKDIIRLAEDNKGNIWVRLKGEGVSIYTPTSTIVRINGLNSISNDILKTTSEIFFDKEDNVWATSHFNGGGWFNLKNLEFQSFEKKVFHCLPSGPLSLFSEIYEQTLYITTNQELFRTNLTSGQCERVDIRFNGKIIKPYIMGFLIDRSGNMWLGTNRGLYSRKKDSSEFQFHNDLGPTNVFDIFENGSGSIYFATTDGVFVKPKNNTQIVKAGNNLKSEFFAFSFLHDAKGEILVASWQGIYRISKDNQLLKLDILPKNVANLPVRVAFIDSKSNFWIGVEGAGLYVFDKKNKLIFKETNPERLSAVRGFRSITEISPSNVWISGTSSLARVNIYADKVENFSNSDGMVFNQFTPHSAIYLGDNLFFGSKGGIVAFNPSDIEKDMTPPKPVISKLLINNVDIKPGRDYDDFSIHSDISLVEEIELKEQHASFSFEFTGIQFKKPKKHRFAYKLDGYDTKWNYTSYKYRRATYSNLPGGTYNFNVKVTNEMGGWSSPASIKVVVHPAIWLTKFAFFLYLFALTVIVFLLIKWRTHTLETRSMKLERKVQERTQELSQEKNKVEKLLDKKTDEITNISHEFRTPLSLILGPTKEILDLKPDSDITSKLEIIQRNSNRLLRMVDQLLNLESDKVNAISNKVLVSPSNIVESCYQAFIPLATSQNISLTLLRNDEFSTNFTIDGIEKILTNLLSNAVKYTKQNGEIRIKSTLENKKWTLSVSDTGVGIEKKNHHAVFERFNRVIDSDSEVITGAGIGLALVKQIVENNEGQILLTSELGKGTQVTIEFPNLSVVNTEKSATTNQNLIGTELSILHSPEFSSFPSAFDERVTSNLKKILIVEDNHEMLAFISRCLNSEYNVLTAHNGKEGIEKAIAEVPDLIVSDIMMPVMDGIELLTQVRRSPITDHIPFILLTAKGDKQSKLEGLNLSADEYITKPFDKDELNARISNLISMRESLYQKFTHSISSAESLLGSTTRDGNDSSQEVTASKECEFIQCLNACLDQCYQDSEIRIASVASNLALSERQLYRKLKSISGMTPNIYLRQFRLEKACTLLSKGMSSGSVSLEVGFSSQSYFSKCFREKFGVSPAKFVSTNKHNMNESANEIA